MGEIPAKKQSDHEKNASETFECMGKDERDEGFIAEKDSIINEMRVKLADKDDLIKNLTEKCRKNDDLWVIAEKEKYEAIINAKEQAIASLLQQVKEKVQENKILVENIEQCKKDHIAEKERNMKNELKIAEDFQKKCDEIEKKYEEKVEENNKISKELQHIKGTFLDPVDKLDDLTGEQIEVMNECFEFIRLNSKTPSTVKARNKSIQMKINAINRYVDACETLFDKCK